MSGIRTRFTLAIGATVAAAVLVLTVVVGLGGAWMLQGTHDLALQREATRVASLVRANVDWVGSGSCEFATSPACTTVITADTPLGRTTDGVRVTAEQRALATAGSEPRELWSEDRIGDRRIRVLTVSVDDGRALIVASTAASVDRSVDRLRLLLLLAGLGVVVGAALVSAVVAGRLARPVRLLADTAERVMSASDPSARMAIQRRDEVGQLARAMDGMLARLERSDTARRNLIADASHDLRSPLTAMTANLELLEDPRLPESLRAQVLDDVRDETDDMSRLVQSILDLARAESQPLRQQEVLPAELVHDAVAIVRRRWRTTQIVVDTHLPAGASSRGDAELLVRAIVNVLDNAAKYSAPDARIEVGLGADTTSWWLEVADAGTGIPPQELPRVFDRFTRAGDDTRVPGSGVGLAMVLQTARQHGGDVVIRSTTGAGTTVRLTIPHQPDAAGAPAD